MTTTKSTGSVTELRRCHGSARFGIEPHEAPVSTFPKQPSRKDGLGVMCTEHWKAYVKGLREARIAAAGAARRSTRSRRRRTPPPDERPRPPHPPRTRTRSRRRKRSSPRSMPCPPSRWRSASVMPTCRRHSRRARRCAYRPPEPRTPAPGPPSAHPGAFLVDPHRVPMTACRGTPAPGRAHRGSQEGPSVTEPRGTRW